MGVKTFSGVVSAVAQNGTGIKIGNVWYNAVGDAKKFINSETLRYKNVELTLSNPEKREFDYIQIFNGKETIGNKPLPTKSKSIKNGNLKNQDVSNDINPSLPPSDQPVKPYLSKDDYWKQREIRDIVNQERISRHGSFNSAIELTKIIQGKGEADAESLIKSVAKLADRIKKWTDKLSTQ